MAVQRIHVTGGPGTGKSTLARRLAVQLGLQVLDLDGLSIEAGASPFLQARAEAMAAEPRWISEGAYLDWTHAFFERADLIVWMDVPWRVASYRILMRHFKASLTRNNRFPGLGNLYRFWRWSSRYYGNRNLHDLNIYGTPETRNRLIEELQGYETKLVRCHTRAENEVLLRDLAQAANIDRETG